MREKKKIVMTIAGSDSSAGAGIQSDLKTFDNYRVYGLTVITAITAQNTTGVQKTYEVPPIMIDAQLKSLFADFKISAVKTGMLSSDKAVKVVAKNLKGKNLKIVIDPIVLSKNDFPLLDTKGIEALKKYLMPLAYLVTPNLNEAELLSGFKIKSGHELNLAAKKIYSFGCRYVLIKGGHFSKQLGIEKGVDILFDGARFTTIKSAYINSNNTHGIGCTLSAAITANIARGLKIQNAIIDAKLYIVKSLKKSIKIGKGVSPIEQ